MVARWRERGSGRVNAPFSIPVATLRNQRLAADPAASAWVSANAGAGKTKVLTDRVIRLLLDGAPPARILCLTFTKAAAANMTIRVFGELGSWVTLPDPDLRDRIEAMTGERADRSVLARARRLFARAVETPGGLKIETIHAFCERLLHLVPFEAEVPARFAVLDDSKAAELAALARGRVLTEAALGGAGRERLSWALGVAGLWAAGESLTKVLTDAVAHPGLPADPAALVASLAELRGRLGLGSDDRPDAIRHRMLAESLLGAGPADWLAVAAAFRRTASPKDADLAADLEASAAAPDLAMALPPYLAVFFTDKGEPRKDVGTKKVDPAIRDRLAAEQARLVALKDALNAAEAAERTEALWVLAVAIRRETEAAKARLGALDFGDLIARTLKLLQSLSAAWVLYKLDRGIDHVLVDEAQDTNPDQWLILRHLTEDFTAGEGRLIRAARTLFAVGDPKQSIYSFQGADPRWFEKSRRHWMGQVEGARLRFADVRLDLSFRSAPAILRAVDMTFAVTAHYRGLSFGDEVRTAHTSARDRVPGHVEIWPTERRAERNEDPDAWSIPLDVPDEEAPAVKVAKRVAAAIRHWTTRGDETGRVWRPGDVLVLARKRGPAFFAAIRACKAAGLPVAGADRFDIGEHLAVNDLVAAGQAALLPANDLALAAALKSPLVGLDDDDLIRIAADRGEAESLADALARCAEAGDAAAREAASTLDGWRALARAHGPFGFYAALLGPGGGRRRLVARLGGEAADAIDAFLCEAETAESGPEAPSLASFLARFEAAEHTIKRDMDATGDEIRVMTVHGAKGLEAPIVIVIDGCEVSGPGSPFVALPRGEDEPPFPVWSPGRPYDCAVLASAREAARQRELEEHNRLLYVAMTRAKDRLVLAPYAGRSEPDEAWCAMVRRGFAAAAAEWTEVDHGYGPTFVWTDATGLARNPGRTGEEGANSLALDVPGWLHAPVPPEPEPRPPLRPSGALGAAERDPEQRRTAGGGALARRRGLLVHALLEHLADLPASEHETAAARLAAIRAANLPAGLRDGAVAEALAVLAHPDLAPLFGPGSRAEAPIAGTIRLPSGETREVSGQVDRLAVLPDRVLVADFKTGAPETPLPAAYLGQLALYRALLSEMEPHRPVEAWLVWTEGPRIVAPSAEAFETSLAGLCGPAHSAA
ncbi:MAG: double-strand break repair helicase AddA [Methylobacteriaceae bacterium]|nr:double-strand break repair helicase AddA [Methylobacteriaceae bacterium]